MTHMNNTSMSLSPMLFIIFSVENVIASFLAVVIRFTLVREIHLSIIFKPVFCVVCYECRPKNSEKSILMFLRLLENEKTPV